MADGAGGNEANGNEGEFPANEEEYVYQEYENENEAREAEEARNKAAVEANLNLRNRISEKKEERAKQIANRSPTCGGVVPSIKRLGKIQLVVVVAVRPTDTKEYDWVLGVKRFLEDAVVPFSAIHIYFAFYNSDRKEHEIILEYKMESFLNEFNQAVPIQVHIYNDIPWTKKDILKTISDSEHSTYLVLFGHGANKPAGTEIELTYEPAGETGLKLHTMKGTDLLGIASAFPENKHLVVVTTACYASNFLNESIIPPNIHYIFQGESGVCKPNSSKRIPEYVILLKFFYTPFNFIPLIEGVDLHNAKNPDFQIDIHSCNSLIVFRAHLEDERENVSGALGGAGANGGASGGRRRRRRTTRKKKVKSKRKSRSARRYY